MVGPLDNSDKIVYDGGEVGAEGEGETEGGGMKRYLVFAGADYYPAGGWGDCVASCDSLDEAKQQFDKHSWQDWIQVVDLESEEVVEEREALP